MKNAKEASANIKRFALMMQGLIDFAQDLDSVESVAGHVQELENKKSKILKDIDVVESAKKRVEAEEKERQSAVEKKVKDSEAKAESILLKAQEAYDKIVSEAKNKLFVAEVDAKEILSLARASLDRDRKELAAVKMELEEQSIVLDKIKKEIQKFKSL